MSDHPYDRLGPDMVIDAVESAGYLSDARLLALNSYENRVYQVGIEDSVPLIAKFYRPERWSDAQILEEHAFSLELQSAEISVVAPIVDSNGNTLHEFDGFRFALFERRGGHPPPPVRRVFQSALLTPWRIWRGSARKDQGRRETPPASRSRSRRRRPSRPLPSPPRMAITSVTTRSMASTSA